MTEYIRKRPTAIPADQTVEEPTVEDQTTEQEEPFLAPKFKTYTPKKASAPGSHVLERIVSFRPWQVEPVKENTLQGRVMHVSLGNKAVTIRLNNGVEEFNLRLPSEEYGNPGRIKASVYKLLASLSVADLSLDQVFLFVKEPFSVGFYVKTHLAGSEVVKLSFKEILNNFHNQGVRVYQNE